MAQTGYTPISIYYSSTASNTPTAGNLVAGELAINTADGKLFYKDSAGVVQVIGTKGGVGTSSTTQVLYNSSGLVVGSANMVFDGSTLTTLNTAYTGTLTGGTGIVNLGSGQFYKDASGNVGIGTSSPNGPLDVNATIPRVVMSISGTAKGQMNIAGSAMNLTANDATYPMTFNTGGGERMRIDSSGRVLVGVTSGNQNLIVKSASGAAAASLIAQAAAGSPSDLLYFYGSNGSTLLGYIGYNGTIVTYNATSDYRLKDNVKPMESVLEKISLLKPCIYTWKSNNSNGQGFIAHELAEVFPEAVSGSKDELFEDGSMKPQGIDTSILVASLTKAIQELNAKVTALEAQLSKP